MNNIINTTTDLTHFSGESFSISDGNEASSFAPHVWDFGIPLF